MSKQCRAPSQMQFKAFEDVHVGIETKNDPHVNR